MTRTMPDFSFDRFELPDLLVALCEAGQTSLAARIARALFDGGRERTQAGRERDQRDGRATGGAGSADGAGVDTTGRHAGASGHGRDERERGGEDRGVTGDEAKAPRSVQTLERNLEAPRRRR